MDFRLREETDLASLPERLSAALPEGITALAVYPAERKARELKWLAVAGLLEYDDRNAEEMCASLRAFFTRESLVIRKKTKRGEGEADIALAIRSLAFEAAEGGVCVHAVLSAQEPTVSPEHLLTALRQLAPDLSPDFATFTRRETYAADMTVFR